MTLLLKRSVVTVFMAYGLLANSRTILAQPYTFTTLAGPEGGVVTNADSQSATLARGFTYVAPASTIGVWTSGGPYGGDARALAINPTTPTTLYAGTNGNGVFKSTDSGGTWSAANMGLTNLRVRALAIDPTTPATLYAGGGGGVFKSSDSGGTWAAANTGLTNLDVRALAINPTAPATLYAGTYLGGIFKSTDSGGTWAAANTGLTTLDVRALAINPMTPSTLYAGTYGGGVFKSTDSGGIWTVANAGLTNIDVNTLAINPTTASTLYAGTYGGGVFRSTDSGGIWANTGLPGSWVYALAIDPTNPATLYAGRVCGGCGGVFKSADSGGTWAATSTGPTYPDVIALAINPATPATLYAGSSGSGVFKSRDSGGTWADANTGLTTLYVDALAINPTTATLYAGTYYKGVIRSTDAGGTWAAANTGLTDGYVLALAINPTIPATVYAGTIYGGVSKSTDSGGTWAAANTGLSSPSPNNRAVNALAINPATSTTLYAGTDGGVFRSTDSGDTWAAANTGLTSLDVRALAINPTTPATLYAGTYRGGVFRSTDSGGTWAAANTGLTDRYVLALAINPTTPATLYAGTYGGIFKSTDSGGTWAAVSTGLTSLAVLALAINPRTPTTLYAGTYGGGVYASTDSGGSWAAANTGLPNLNVQALALDPTGATTLYAGLAFGSVWQLTPSALGSAPTISAITPTSGTTAGGQSVTITGTNLSGATSVTFGGTAGAITANTATSIAVTTPARGAGAVDVVVTTAGGSSTATNGYTYETVFVNTINPTSGATVGGTAVTVRGTHFTAGATLTIGGATALVVFVTATTIEATTPAHVIGTADVVVRNTDGQTGTLTGGFTYSNTPPEQTPPDRGNLPENPGLWPTPATKAVVITHGYKDNAAGWVREMAEKVCGKLGVTPGVFSVQDLTLTKVCQGNDWDVWVLDWRSSAAWTYLPWGAYANASDLGENLASLLKVKNYSHIHLIAHSAGANLIDFATIGLRYWVLKENRPALKIHNTFLDAYDPRLDRSRYGKQADWTDNYVDTRDVADLSSLVGFDGTNLLLQNGYNIDVTPTSVLDPCNQFLIPFDVWRCRHNRPIRFYGLSVDSSFLGHAPSATNDPIPINGTGAMGYPLSVENGVSLSTLNNVYPKGAKCVMSGGICYAGSLPFSVWSFVPRVVGTVIDVVTGTVNFIPGVGSTVIKILKLGLFPLLPNSTTSLPMGLSAATTESPSFIAMDVTTLQPVNTMLFNWRFAATGEGFLRVFVDGILVREIDQRHVSLTSLTTEEIYIGGGTGTLAPGIHRIAFRLDGFGTSASGVELTGVELGLTASGRISGDANGDGSVNAADLTIVHSTFQTTRGAATPSTSASDCNADGQISALDVLCVFSIVHPQPAGLGQTTLKDIDRSGNSDALTDGLLLLRRLFGFGGLTLINGAVAGGAVRTGSADIQTYVDALGPVFDIDRNGTTDALTDGLLLLRFLFGFRGNTLINGAIGSGALRTDAASIEAYLTAL